MEDVALAGSYRAAGLPVTVVAGRGLASFRMYRGGVRSIVAGWSKGLGDGVRRVRLPTLLAVGAWLSGAASVPLVLATRPLLGAVLWVAFAGQLGWLARRAGRFPAWSWLVFPVTLAFFVAVFLRSTLAVLLHRPARWKGRRLEA
jgi:4,4'-diaponeurosporenoate glycosyltransferase